jgi:hypothetical protein
MLWIKIDFYKLIWLNENIKNICDFSYVHTKHRKMFLVKNIFLKNSFLENILQRKPFYIQTNGE